MTRFNSIRTSLTVSIFGFLVIVIAIAVASITSLRTVDDNAALLAQKWLAGTQLLGELTDRISEFRVAETYRALAPTPERAAEAETLAQAHRAAVADLTGRYLALVGPQHAPDEMRGFMQAWTSYLDQHDAWVKADAKLQIDDPARYDSPLHQAYEAADSAIDKLVARNEAEARAQAGSADRASDFAVALVASLAVLAGLLTAALIGKVRGSITEPLATITNALSRLAAGSRDVHVPELHRRDEIGEMAKAFEVFRANAVALEEAQELAASLARHDALTGLPNRRLFSAELELALAEVRKGASDCAVMQIDLDRFKPVNDLNGHAAGDVVLCEVAQRLESLVDKTGLVARLGGDEFAVILPTPTEPKARAEAAMRLAGRIVAAMREPMFIDGARIEIGASVGVAICPVDGAEPEALLRAADLAMYRAKQDGRGTFRFFEASMDQDLRSKAALEADLRGALDSGEIEPFYQPLIEIGADRICGFEVLARWNHPERGFIPPDIFIPMAEQLGLVGDLTCLILRRACRDARDWQDGVRLALNISPAQFQDPALPSLLLAILDEEQFPASRLEVEVTESALVGDIEAAKYTLDTLQQIGIRVALDDFGTGYSSLYHLRELKFDKLKIDRSFVQSMQTNAESEKIVNAVLGLAHSLGMPAVAEGIEDVATKRLLAQRGCEYGQGYLFSKAVPAEAAGALLSGPVPDLQRLAS